MLTSLWSHYSILLAILQVDLYIPTSGNKSVPAGLAAAVEAEDLRSAVVVQASFWWHGGALPVKRGGIGVRVIRCVPRQRRLVVESC